MLLDAHALRQSCVQTDADMLSAKILLRACIPCFLVPKRPGDAQSLVQLPSPPLTKLRPSHCHGACENFRSLGEAVQVLDDAGVHLCSLSSSLVLAPADPSLGSVSEGALAEAPVDPLCPSIGCASQRALAVGPSPGSAAKVALASGPFLGA